MIAAAGEVGELSPPVAWSVLLLSLLALAGVVLLFPRTMLFRLVPLEKSPDALVEQARTVVAAAGLPRTARDDSYALDTNDDFFAAARKSSSPARWENLDQQRPGVFLFHYRQSPNALVPSNQEGRVTVHDPPLTVPGMTHVTLDMSGRLISFTAVPTPSKPAADASARPDWTPFFEFAGGDLERLTPVPSLWPAPVGTDATYAWEGVFRDQPAIPMRVEAASQQGQPVWFKIFPVSAPPSKPTSDDPRAASLIYNLVTAGVLIAGVILARRNLRRGRGDRRTATRLAFVVFVLGAVAHLLRADHVASAGAERLIIERGLAWSLFRAAEVWVLYLALEPFVRRRWPHTLISWTRLFAGRLRDPMIGRDLLIGTGTGLLLQVLFMGGALLPTLFGQPALAPFARWATPLISLRHVFYTWFRFASEGLVVALTILLMLLIALILLRLRWAAVAAVWLFIAIIGMGGGNSVFELPVAAVAAGLFVFLMLRYGVLTLAIAFFVASIMEAAPLTLDPDAWYFTRGMAPLLLILSMIAYGFIASLGGKPAFALPSLDET